VWISKKTEKMGREMIKGGENDRKNDENRKSHVTA